MTAIVAMTGAIDAPTWGFLGLLASGVLALIGTLVTQHRTRQENSADHGRVREAIEALHEDVRTLNSDVRDVRDEQRQHLRWHLDHQNGDGR